MKENKTCKISEIDSKFALFSEKTQFKYRPKLKKKE
jgi:hypothetical protein